MINSDYGCIEIGSLYIGWNNHPFPPVNEDDVGDETFGLCMWRFYIGHYNGSGWCGGILNEAGALDD